MKTWKTHLLGRMLAGVLVLSLSLGVTEAAGREKPAKNAPLFTQFTYQGADAVYEKHPLQPGEFYNPILQGCYPDPSITRKGGDYYLVCSSFAMYPGVPVFHSTDLVNWRQVGHALERRSQLQLDDCGISAGVYAPTIRYNPHNDTFYMITTQFSGGFGNIVVKTRNPEEGWSDPVKLAFEGIDPDIFFDDNGKAYVVHNDAPPQGTERYEGHRVIKVWEYDVEKDQVVAGTDRIIVDGGVNIAEHPIWIEAPHIYKKDGRYYLMCAEGGTGGWHSEVIFMSDHPKGPYVPAPGNPILTQRYFPADRADKVDWAGHADLIEGPDGKYYGVFLAIRPNEKNRVNTGRETFILPVDWSGTFPVFQNGLVPMKPVLQMPVGVRNLTGTDGYMPNGNFRFTDEFTSPKLDLRWIGVRGPREAFATAGGKRGGVRIAPFATHIKEVKPTSTLFYRQQHNSFTATVTMEYMPTGEQDLAGITCYQSERFHYLFGMTRKGEKCYLQLLRTERGVSTLLGKVEVDPRRPLALQVTAQGDDYRFNYAADGAEFTNLGGTVSGDILSTNVAGGFTGALIGLHATTGHQ